ncbi:MAG TPA: NAD(P)/FAD-dependent oxidoreductase [Azospirillaceae bacterium]|nr:NAD(P)/FAD-dependent oxidoreductase [Azospirillaceae bacterium]
MTPPDISPGRLVPDQPVDAAARPTPHQAAADTGPLRDLTPAPVDDRPHVVIVGAGFGGLSAARALGGAPVRVTLVDRQNYHLFVPLLYQVATAVLSPADIAQPIRRLVARHPNIDVVMGEVTGIDAASRRLILSNGYIPYDKLVIAAGSTHGYFGHDEWAAHAPGLKTIEDARRIRGRLLRAFERAELEPDPAERSRLTTAVVVGGGPTGVEMAGALAGLIHRALSRDFRRIRPEAARIVLVEAGPRILSAFPQDLSDYAHRALQRLGVEVRLGEKVEAVEAGAVTVSGKVIPAETVVWAAGVQASPFGRWLGVPTDRAGHIPVGPDFAVPGVPDVYAIGDIAHVQDKDGKPLPGLAQVAQQEGRHLGRGLAALLGKGVPIPPFRFRNFGNWAVIGQHHAVADFGRTRMKGWSAWVMWCVIHIYLLIGFRNRLLVSVQWLWAWLTNERGARLITDGAGQLSTPASPPAVPPGAPVHKRPA